MLRKALIVSNNRSASDRFIPRREDTELAYHLIESPMNNNLEATAKFSDMGIKNPAQQLYLRRNYSSLLRTALLPPKIKVLQFSSPKKDHTDKNGIEPNSWPVAARLKPLLTTSPSILLDMPDLSTALNRQVIDWGKNGYMATAYNGEVHLWHPSKNERFVTKTNGRVEYCVKWNSIGTIFAVALKHGKIALWEFRKEKTLMEIKCPCIYDCTITAMSWTNTHDLITGCSNGRINLYSSASKQATKEIYFSYIRAHLGDIINIKISPRERYFVSTGKDGKVNIWFLPKPEIKYQIVFDFPIKAIDFHPWTDSLLAVGSPESIDIWNINTQKKIDSRRQPGAASVEYVDCLTFNSVSGELVVSSFCSNNDEIFTSVKVFKNLDTVVDELQFQFGRIPYLLWDITGTELAIAASDESLSIWNFFGKSTELVRKKWDRNKKLTTNMFETLNMFGNTIR